MKCRASPCRRHRFPPEIIQHAVWLFYRFNLSHRDIQDILARRAVDQDGEVIDVLLRERRGAASARRFFRHLLARLGGEPRTVVTDKPGSYAVARRELLPGAAHDCGKSSGVTRIPGRLTAA